MEQLKMIKEQLIAQVQAQMADLKCVDTKELGEVIDMIKDIAQAQYYCKVYEAMEETQEEGKETNNYYYTEKYLPAMTNMSRDMSRYPGGRMYYGDGGNPSGGDNASNGGTKMYSSRYGHEPGRSEEYYEREYPLQYLRDEREGRSPVKRKMYMESKTNGSDSTKSMKDLESYMQDLTSDMLELLDKASPDEKAMV